jgi:hypothetical protein
MDNQFLRDLNVTADELAELQQNERPFGLLTERQREILDAGRDHNQATEMYCTAGHWSNALSRSSRCDPAYTYRLNQNLTLPSKPRRPSNPRKPFKWQIDGQEVWCCPVYVDEERDLVFTKPFCGDPACVGLASSTVGWLGCMEADEDGFPIDRLWGNDISMALPVHHGSSSSRIDFVCFKVEGDQ